jgi:hypothetical protein
MTDSNRLAATFFEVRLSDSPRTGTFLVDGTGTKRDNCSRRGNHQRCVVSTSTTIMN